MTTALKFNRFAIPFMRHTCGGPKFGRLTAGCPRCGELATGAEPRRWKQSEDARRVEAMRRFPHDCKRAGCLPICTYGDW